MPLSPHSFYVCTCAEVWKLGRSKSAWTIASRCASVSPRSQSLLVRLLGATNGTNLQRFEQKKQELNLPDDYGVGDIDAGVNSHCSDNST